MVAFSDERLFFELFLHEGALFGVLLLDEEDDAALEAEAAAGEGEGAAGDGVDSGCEAAGTLCAAAPGLAGTGLGELAAGFELPEEGGPAKISF